MDTASQVTTSNVVQRVINVLRLHRPTYEEIGSDPRAMPQALMVIALAALGNGIAETRPDGLGLIGGFATLIVGWLVISLATWVMSSIFSSETEHIGIERVLQILAFANAPLIFYALAPLPVIGALASFVVLIWAFVVLLVAISVAIRTTMFKAFLTVIVGGIAAGFAILLFVRPFLI